MKTVDISVTDNGIYLVEIWDTAPGTLVIKHAFPKLNNVLKFIKEVYTPPVEAVVAEEQV